MIQEEAEKGKLAYQKDSFKEAEQHFTAALDLLAGVERETGGVLSPPDSDLKARVLSNRGRVRRDGANYPGAIEDFTSSLKQVPQQFDFARNLRNNLLHVLLLLVAARRGVTLSRESPEKEPEILVPLLIEKVPLEDAHRCLLDAKIASLPYKEDTMLMDKAGMILQQRRRKLGSDEVHDSVKHMDSEAWHNLGLSMKDKEGEKSGWHSLETVQVGSQSYSQQQCYVQAVSVDPRNPKPWYNLGLTLSLGDTVQIGSNLYTKQQCYEKFLTLDPTSPYVWYILGVFTERETVQVGSQRYTKQQCFLQALTLRPEYADVWYNLGDSLGVGETVQVGGQSYSKQQCYVQALTLDPKTHGKVHQAW